MPNGIPDFRPRPQQDVGAIARLMQQQQLINEQRRATKQQEQRQFFTDLLSAVQTGQQIAANAMETSEARRTQKLKRQLAKEMKPVVTEAELQRPVTAAPELGPDQRPVTFAETAQGQELAALEARRPERIRAIAAELSPETFIKEALTKEELTPFQEAKLAQEREKFEFEKGLSLRKEERIANYQAQANRLREKAITAKTETDRQRAVMQLETLEARINREFGEAAGFRGFWEGITGGPAGMETAQEQAERLRLRRERLTGRQPSPTQTQNVIRRRTKDGRIIVYDAVTKQPLYEE